MLSHVADEFKIILKHLKNYLTKSKYESSANYKFFSTEWLWYDVECRKNKENKIMMILSCNPGKLTKVK